MRKLIEWSIETDLEKPYKKTKTPLYYAQSKVFANGVQIYYYNHNIPYGTVIEDEKTFIDSLDKKALEELAYELSQLNDYKPCNCRSTY